MRVTADINRRWQTMIPVTAKHSRAVILRSTEHSSHESATCLKIDQTSSSLRCKCVLRDGQAYMERVKRIGRYLAGKPRAELDVYSDADWTGRQGYPSVSVGWGHQRGGHCLKTWTKRQQAVSPHSAVRSRQLRVTCGLNLHLRLCNIVLGQSQRTGQSQTRRRAELVDTGGFQVWQVRHEEGWHECDSS